MNRLQILLWRKHPGDLLGNAIHVLTHGPWEHAGFRLPNSRTVHELYLPELRDREMADAEIPLVDAFDIEGLTDVQEDHFLHWFATMKRVRMGYSIADLFRIELNAPFPSDLQGVCSAYVIKACSVCLPPAQLPLVRCSWDQVSPRDLGISPRLIGPVAIEEEGAA